MAKREQIAKPRAQQFTEIAIRRPYWAKAGWNSDDQREYEAGAIKRVDAMRAATPPMTPILAIAIDQWIDMGGENDPSLGILLGTPKQYGKYPWAAYPRLWSYGTSFGPTAVVHFRGPLDAATFEVVKKKDHCIRGGLILVWRN